VDHDACAMRGHEKPPAGTNVPLRLLANREPVMSVQRFRSTVLEYSNQNAAAQCWPTLTRNRTAENAMARPREFDEDAVLDAAVYRFWLHGYNATSVRELAESMGITNASLYNAFGDKRALFRRALAHYVENSFGHRVSRFEAKLSPREAIGAFFREIVERSVSDDERKGCLLVNSALEVAPHDPEFQKAIAEVLMKVESFFRRCVAAGQASGEISNAQSADDLAGLLLSTLLGIRVLARARPERALLEGLMRPALALLDADVR
jgi:TetR/AcrR family transcriptional regulator, transcriptional repressor for nem operon